MNMLENELADSGVLEAEEHHLCLLVVVLVTVLRVFQLRDLEPVT